MMKKGIGMIGIVLISLAFLLVIFFGLRIIGAERAKTRDAQRVADMARIQVGFMALFNRTASYAQAAQNGCDAVGSPVRVCNLAQDFPSVKNFKDPKGTEYLVSKVPDATTYEITFSLEVGATGLAKGKHTLTPAGIK
ncbi:MAG: hypothetical protein WCT08_03035 [Patescibacteria group bacterium]|jgi:hypothetical protein